MINSRSSYHIIFGEESVLFVGIPIDTVKHIIFCQCLSPYLQRHTFYYISLQYLNIILGQPISPSFKSYILNSINHLRPLTNYDITK